MPAHVSYLAGRPGHVSGRHSAWPGQSFTKLTLPDRLLASRVLVILFACRQGRTTEQASEWCSIVNDYIYLLNISQLTVSLWASDSL